MGDLAEVMENFNLASSGRDELHMRLFKNILDVSGEKFRTICKVSFIQGVFLDS